MKLRTLGLSAVGVLGLCTLMACKKDEAAPVAPETPAAPPAIKAAHLADDAPPPEEKPAPRTGGSVHGVVSFKGKPPAPSAIPAGTDPNCEGMDLEDQPVQVKDGKLANVVVRVRGQVPGQHAPAADSMVVVDQNRCMYKPRVQGALVGQPLVLMNSDSTVHNVRGTAGAKPLFNVMQPPLKTRETMPLGGDAEIIRLKCDIHPWMTAWVVMNPNSFFTTSEEDGAFTLEGVPPGSYTLEAWHETLGTRTAQVTVQEGQRAEVSFEFAPATP
jgi:plastocyanin